MTQDIRPLISMAIAAVLAAESAALVAAPWSTDGGCAVATALLLPSALLLAALLFLLRRRSQRWMRGIGRLGGVLGLSPLQAVGGFGATEVSGVLGTAAILHWVVDAPLGSHSLLCFVSLGFLAALIGIATAWALPAQRSRERWSRALAGLLLATGLGLGITDGLSFPREQVGLHAALLALTGVSFLAGWALLVPRAPGRWALTAAAVALLFASAAARVGGPPYEAIARTYSSHQRVLRAARALLDRDGDGYSAWLGGGDCDDDDRRAFPLATHGRDCLGWMDPASPPPGRGQQVAQLATPPAPAPATVVLLTIDAFRCGFGVEGVPPLRDACPALSALGREGFARLDAHTIFPVTTRALGVLHTGDLYAGPRHRAANLFSIAGLFKAHGYATHAIVTHPYTVADPRVPAAFDEVDMSLVPRATDPAGTTAEEVTDRVLATLDRAGDGKVLVWAHYLDPHAPYVDRPGEAFASPSLDLYAAEVRRTDAAIGRLAAALARRHDAEHTFLFVTADHGEELGEHGAHNHGAALYEEVVRVPMLAWSAGQGHRALGDPLLPRSTAGVAGYLASLLTHRRTTEADDVFMRARSRDDPQLALLTPDGWKLIYHRALGFMELYDLKHDPAERIDRSAAEPAMVARLGRRLAAFYRTLRQRRERERRAR